MPHHPARRGKYPLYLPKGFIQQNPAFLIAASFALVILTGAVLLTLPVSSREGEFTPFLNALFVATSATCVTGLTVYDTYLHFSLFGQTVIISLIQVGGLGLVTMTSFFYSITRRKVGLRNAQLAQESISADSRANTMKLLSMVIKVTFVTELIGAVLFMPVLIPEFGWYGLYMSVFFAISSYCNAGFDLFGMLMKDGSLIPVQHNPYFLTVVMLLIICGGLGFVVWQNIRRRICEKKRLDVYSRLVLLITGLLVVLGTAVIAAAEWNNPETLGPMPVPEKLLCGFFQSVTFRTAGFNTIDLGAMTGMSKAASMLLMFIGGSSGSTAGGIKTVTFGLLIIAAFRVARGNRDVVVMKRRVDTGSLLRALSITVISLMIICFGAFLISLVDGITFEDVLFETFSAFGTVGVTTGVTTQFSYFGKLLLMAMMFFGRVGILTITYEIMIGLHSEKEPLRRPKAEFLIG